jgi:tRNA G18 (ribose-2'-O)-methylase SpoU
MLTAGPDDLDLFSSLRGTRCPPDHFIGDGERVVRRMVERGIAVRILCTPEWPARLSLSPGLEVRIATQSQMEDIVGYRLHQGLMALGRRIIPAGPPAGSLLVALDGVNNAENVGAAVRSCAAFGVDGLIAGPATASPWLRRAIRTSMGATLSMPIHEVADLPAFLRPRRAYAAHIHGERVDYRDVDFRGDACLVIGGEAGGVSDEVLRACTGVIYIPMAGGWDCLNAAASLAVLLAEVRRQRRGDGASRR